jgi:hypothetical protein
VLTKLLTAVDRGEVKEERAIRDLEDHWAGFMAETGMLFSSSPGSSVGGLRM